MGEILGGVTQDGGGFIIVGGKIIKIPPRSPVLEVLNALVALAAISDDQTNEVEEVRNDALQSSLKSIQKAMRKILNSKG